jgi:uncharacterized protein YgiM (DUF1202 family)
MRSQTKLSTRRSVALLCTLVVTAIGAAMAEEVVVQVQSLVVRAGKGSMHPPVGEAKKDERLTVIERQPDGWLKVQIAGNRQGFVKETALEPRSAANLTPLVRGASALTGNTSDTGASAAARGIRPDADKYASGKGMNTTGLQQMIANRDRVSGDRWVQFAQEGNVGPAARR